MPPRENDPENYDHAKKEEHCVYMFIKQKTPEK